MGYSQGGRHDPEGHACATGLGKRLLYNKENRTPASYLGVYDLRKSTLKETRPAPPQCSISFRSVIRLRDPLLRQDWLEIGEFRPCAQRSQWRTEVYTSRANHDEERYLWTTSLEETFKRFEGTPSSLSDSIRYNEANAS